MSYIIKNSTQGAIVARLTDAGRKKLSEGKLNIGLFQLGDSEICYDCYNQLPAQTGGINILQAEHNAQNLLPQPEKNKGHVKYPILGGVSTGDTFGPTLPQHEYTEVFNTATARGFFSGTTNLDGTYTFFSAQTGADYTLSSNWNLCPSAMTGTTNIQLVSGTCTNQYYTPVVGDLISVTYEYSGNSCDELNYTAASQTLFYQILSGNYSSAQTNTIIDLTVDRNIPNLWPHAAMSAISATCVHVRVYPSFSANPLTTNSIYNTATTGSYWCDDTLSFNNCAGCITNDVKIWNMNINWTHTVAGVNTLTYENKDFYGSSGYCGSKEYFGLESDNGQTFSNQVSEGVYNPQKIGGTWYLDSFDNIRVVLPSEQKCAGMIHYTNNTTTDFYGEKFAMKTTGYNPVSTIGEARNFKLHLPWLMWHKKNVNGSGDGTGAGNENILGQTFYVDPPNYPDAFPGNPHVMQSNMNSNMNDLGLRYFHLWDDNVGSGDTPNRVGKVFPDYKMMVIDDEELLAAMSYKSNRSWTLPAPKTEKFPAGSTCASGCTEGAVQNTGDKLYMTYLLANTGSGTTGLHCNYYVSETKSVGELAFDVGFTFGSEFPYLRDLATNATGFDADRLYILVQLVPNGSTLDPANWEYKDVTNEIPNHLYGNKILATNLIGKTFYITADYTDPACSNYTDMVSYNLNNFILIPENGKTGELQFGDEYFLYGTLETDIMATIYEMKHIVQLGTNQYLTSTNPTWVDYNLAVAPAPAADIKITEIGLFDNENGFPDLMAIAKLQSPVLRSGTQQFTIAIDF